MRKKVTMPVVLALIALVIGVALVVVYGTSESGLFGSNGSPMQVELDPQAIEQQPRGPEDEWEHHEWGGPDEARERGGRRGQGERGERHDRGGSRGGHGEGSSDPERIPPPPADDERWDPQMRAMQRSFRAEGDAGPASMPFQPRQLEAFLVQTDLAGTAPGQACQVRVLPVQTRLFNCLVRVVCNGRVLYPNAEQTAGYAPCDVVDGNAVRAVDDGHTAQDGDPLVTFDMSAGTIEVSDHGDGVTPFIARLRLGRRVL